LIGREIAVRRLLVLLSAYHVVTLTGPGGIGKSALALHVARRFLASFDGDGWLVELASLSDPSLVPSAAAGVLGLKLGGGEISAEAVARAIWPKKLLLVLDNCEHVVDAAARLAETIVRLCPCATVLATSREMLRIDGECVYRVRPLEVPPEHSDNPSDVLQHSAAALFMARTKELNSDFSPVEENPSAIAAICRRLDGIPLAIEFAAACGATLGVQQVARGLDDRFRLLTTGRRSALPRHRTLRAALDWSYDLLSDPEKCLLRRLAVFAGGFTIEAAAAVMDNGDNDVSPVMEGIARLLEKSLLTRVGSIAGRWRLLETIRAYAREKLMESGEAERTARRHAEYFSDLLTAAAQDGASADRPGADLTPEIDNIRGALAWAFEHGGNTSIDVALAAASAPVWLELSLLNECAGWMSKALAHIDGAVSGTRREMQLQAALGFALLFSKGITREAYGALLKAAELAERLGDADYQLRTLSGLCRFCLRHRDFRGGLTLARQYETVAARVGDRGAWPTADWMLGFFLFCLGDLTGGRTHMERFIDGYQPRSRWSEIGRHGVDLRAYALSTLGIIRWSLGLPEQAAQASRTALDEARTLGHPVSLCVALLMRGLVSLWLGDLAALEQSTMSLLEHSKTHSLDIYYAHGLGLEGELAALRGDLVTGVRLLRTCSDDLRATEQYLFHSVFFGDLAKWVAAAGDIGAGLAMIDEALESAERSEEAWYLPEILRIKGELFLLRGATGATATAEGLFRQAFNGAHRQGALSWNCALPPASAAFGAMRAVPRRRWRSSSRSTTASPKGSRRLT
jgi:predicted ATPase